MPKYEVLVCDVCGEEQRQDQSIENADLISGPVSFSLENQNAIKRSYSFALMCRHCAEALESYILLGLNREQMLAEEENLNQIAGSAFEKLKSRNLTNHIEERIRKEVQDEIDEKNRKANESNQTNSGQASSPTP